MVSYRNRENVPMRGNDDPPVVIGRLRPAGSESETGPDSVRPVRVAPGCWDTTGSRLGQLKLPGKRCWKGRSTAPALPPYRLRKRIRADAVTFATSRGTLES